MEHSVPWLRPLNGHRGPIINYAEEDAACALEVLDEVPFANATD